MKRKAVLLIFVVLAIADIAAFSVLARSRYFSHLAFCTIRESSLSKAFDWTPENAPSIFKFEPIEGLDIFRQGIGPGIVDNKEDIEKALAIAGYVDTVCARPGVGKRLVWGSPEALLIQAKQGASGLHCFHRGILLSTFLSSVDIPSRLWAFEGKCFDGNAHTINEVYSSSAGKWIFVDVMLNCYAREGDIYLSCLELRQRILSGNTRNIAFFYMSGQQRADTRSLVDRYRILMPYVMLRCRNDFVQMFREARMYGRFSFLSGLIDTLPNGMRIGLSYLLGGNGVFVHYTDEYSRSLKVPVLAVKAAFCILLFAHVVAIVLLLK
jgi:hypothetical protein